MLSFKEENSIITDGVKASLSHFRESIRRRYNYLIHLSYVMEMNIRRKHHVACYKLSVRVCLGSCVNNETFVITKCV